MPTDANWSGTMPAIYDRLLGPALFAPFAAELAARAVPLAPRDVLEIAAGSGIVTAQLVAALPDARITATDLNPAMVALGAETVPGPDWRSADAGQLPFPSGSFDLVVCSFGVMFFPDRVSALAEMARVLRPSGTVLLTVWDDVAASPFPAALVESLPVVLPDDPPLFVVRVPHGYADTARISADLSAAGLSADGIERLVLPGRAGSADELALGFCQGTPLRFELESRGELAALTAAVAEQMTLRLGTGPVSGNLVAHLVTSRRRES